MATNEVILINEKLLKLYSNLTRNVGVDKVMPYVTLAQPFYITPVLGDPLTAELQAEIATDTLTDTNKALLLKIAPALALWTDYLALRSLAYTVTEKGLTKEHSENSESVNEKELAEYKLDIKDKAQKATDLLIKYLCKCRDNYPLWQPEDDCLCNAEEFKGKANNEYDPLIYFPRRKSKCNCN